jgi:hypothetical protein
LPAQGNAAQQVCLTVVGTGTVTGWEEGPPPRAHLAAHDLCGQCCCCGCCQLSSARLLLVEGECLHDHVVHVLLQQGHSSRTAAGAI